MRSWTSLKRDIIESNHKYVLAISGGVDSMCLLDFFIRMIPKGRFCVAHFYHGNRENDIKDLALVEGYTEYNGIPFYSDNGENLTGITNFECEARRQRWAFLENVAEAFGSKVIITAHHKNDYIETFFLRALLRGIPATESIMQPLIKVGRYYRYKPFLCLPKEKLYKIAKAYGVPFNEDETNTDTHYDRNFVRHEIMPRLQSRRNILKTIPGSLECLHTSLKLKDLT